MGRMPKKKARLYYKGTGKNIPNRIDIDLRDSLANSDLANGKKHKKEKGVWQSRYWAHIILAENDLNKHIDYIHFNPMKLYKIAPKDWEYSSFKKFVQNGYYDIDWCNFGDKHQINSMECE